MIDINDYKMIYKFKLKKINKIWIIIIIFMSIGLIFINNRFKYYEYYQNKGEYKDKYINLYVLIDDLDKITKNKEILIDKDKFAYKISSISEDNFYMNNDYYKEVRLSIKKKYIDNDIVDIKIIIKEYSLFEYVFKTVWR